MKTRLLPLLLFPALVACQEQAPAVEAPIVRGKAPQGFVEKIPPLPADARILPVTVSDRGYDPATLEARPREIVVLAFTRTSAAECGRYVKVVGTDTQAELPLGRTVKIPVTMPESGEVTFVCGMEMMRGVVKVVPVAAPGE